MMNKLTKKTKEQIIDAMNKLVAVIYLLVVSANMFFFAAATVLAIEHGATDSTGWTMLMFLGNMLLLTWLSYTYYKMFE